MTVDRVFSGTYPGLERLEVFPAKLFVGSTTWAGASAAIMANVVLIGYIIVAMMEDQGDQAEEARKKKGL